MGLGPYGFAPQRGNAGRGARPPPNWGEGGGNNGLGWDFAEFDLRDPSRISAFAVTLTVATKRGTPRIEHHKRRLQIQNASPLLVRSGLVPMMRRRRTRSSSARRAGVRHHHMHAVAQAVRAVDDDLVADIQARRNLRQI